MHISVFTVNVKCLLLAIVLGCNHLRFQLLQSVAAFQRGLKKTALIIISKKDESFVVSFISRIIFYTFKYFELLQCPFRKNCISFQRVIRARDDHIKKFRMADGMVEEDFSYFHTVTWRIFLLGFFFFCAKYLEEFALIVSIIGHFVIHIKNIHLYANSVRAFNSLLVFCLISLTECNQTENQRCFKILNKISNAHDKRRTHTEKRVAIVVKWNFLTLTAIKKKCARHAFQNVCSNHDVSLIWHFQHYMHFWLFLEAAILDDGFRYLFYFPSFFFYTFCFYVHHVARDVNFRWMFGIWIRLQFHFQFQHTFWSCEWLMIWGNESTGKRKIAWIHW